MFRKTILAALAAAVVAGASFTASTSNAEAGSFTVSIGYKGGNGYGWKGKGYGHKNYGHHGYGKGWGYKKCRDVPVYGWNYYGKKVIVGYDRICR